MNLKDIDVNKLSEEDLNTLLSELVSLSVTSPADYTCVAPNGKVHTKQLDFHLSDKKIRFLSGGNRSGKTESGVAEDVMHSTGIYPAWYPEKLRLKSHNRGRVIVTDFTNGGAVFEEKLWKWLPKELVVGISRTVKNALVKVQIRHTDGGISVIEVLTHEQDDMVFEGWSGHWAHFDEPPCREHFMATLRGLIDFKGRCWLTLTPINQPWLYDEFISKEDPDVYFSVVDMYDNPFTPVEELQGFERKMGEEEKESRVHGHFKHLTGLVYKEFDPKVHVIPNDRIIISQNWPKYFVCDPHDRKPHFGIWATVDPLGNIYIIDEICYKGTIQDFSKQVLMRELMNKQYRISPMNVIRVLDPNKGNTPSAVTGLKLKEEFGKHALYFTADVNDDIALGHLAVQEKLHYDKKYKLDDVNHPKMYIFDNCKGVIRYFQMYVWDDWKGAGKDARSQKEKPQEKFKDFMDCIRYLVMSNPTFYVEEPDPINFGFSGTTSYGG